MISFYLDLVNQIIPGRKHSRGISGDLALEPSRTNRGTPWFQIMIYSDTPHWVGVHVVGHARYGRTRVAISLLDGRYIREKRVDGIGWDFFGPLLGRILTNCMGTQRLN